ncbi:CatB-related O-acetyltransferase [Pedobacter sp. MC2016-14]|uniref:CatB-related O-acetyltransferase n=1 Tax=Pedobacter sp. MC2016-14 TaxID=2897327 RepID=UPI00272A1B1B|nr:CatB-related O-acetyltransferase [Pedobacter sp. MC2016-14]
MITLLNTQLGDQCMVGNFSKMAYSKMDTLSYIGDYTVVINAIIGRFCSISWGVTIGPEEHDYTRLTNHSFLYSLKSFQLTPYKHYSPFEKECVIGNDVWIGCNSTILRGVTIGDGAVIGANSLVNKDVPPYAIVAGTPAKVIKYRFNDAVIAALLDLKWWDLPLKLISANTELFAAQPTLGIIAQIKGLHQSG